MNFDLAYPYFSAFGETNDLLAPGSVRASPPPPVARFCLDWGGWSCQCGGLAPAVNMLDESLQKGIHKRFYSQNLNAENL